VSLTFLLDVSSKLTMSLRCQSCLEKKRKEGTAERQDLTELACGFHIVSTSIIQRAEGEDKSKWYGASACV